MIRVDGIECKPDDRHVIVTRIEFYSENTRGTIELRGVTTSEEITNIQRAFMAPGTRTKLLLLSDYVPVAEEIAELKRRLAVLENHIR